MAAKTGMRDTEIVKDVMKVTGTTQAKLAEKLGYKSVSAVTGRLNTPRLSVNRFAAMLDALGYEVVVREKKWMTGDEWIVPADGDKE